MKTRALVLGVFCAVVAVAFLSAREETPRPAAEREDMPIAAATLGMDVPLRTDTMKPTVVKPSQPVVQREPATRGVSDIASIAPSATDDRSASAPGATADKRSTMAAQPDTGAAVTVTGCLEHDDGVFRLTDVSGAGAPTGRSWKSGFLRKRTASVDVEDAVGTLSLRNYVGRRISTNGTLIEREMRARTVRVVGACD